MTVTVFTWDMLKRGPGDFLPGVGHAAMHVSGPQGSIYVSLWPKEHALIEAVSSPAKAHFMNGDKLWDGLPNWASKPLAGLDEGAIIRWWSKIQRNPLIDYNHKQKFQLSTDKKQAFQPANTQYKILSNQCATTVVEGLIEGANPALKTKIENWKNANTKYTVAMPPFLIRGKLISPRSVRLLVMSVWNDTDYRMSFVDNFIARF
jgi:hypothetical protein